MMKGGDEGEKMKSLAGQASVETALVFGTVVMPAVFGVLLVAQAVWTWGGVVHLTRLGAVYAATHCWQDTSGSNVVNYMQTHVPPMIDSAQIVNGPAQIQIQYWTQDAVNHQTVPFECAGSCTPACVPDAVTVTVNGYQFQSLVRVVGLSPINMPPFSTSMHMESVGGNPDTGEAVP